MKATRGLSKVKLILRRQIYHSIKIWEGGRAREMNERGSEVETNSSMQTDYSLEKPSSKLDEDFVNSKRVITNFKTKNSG
jgi:hypothetical protein